MFFFLIFIGIDIKSKTIPTARIIPEDIVNDHFISEVIAFTILFSSKNKNENVEANIINDGIIRTILYFLSAFPILLEFNL